MKKRVFSILTALCLCLTLLPVTVFATEDSSTAPAEQQEEVTPEVDPEQMEEEEKEAQEESAPQPPPSEGEPVMLNAAATEVSTADELTAALANDANGTVKLTADINISGRINIINRTVTIDLNGHVIQGNGSNIIFYISNGHLTLNDSDPEKPHKFTTGSPWALNENDGTEIVKGGVITGGNAPTLDSKTGGVFVDSGASFTMNGGNIVGCATQRGSSGAGGVYNNGTFTMNGGSIRGCLSRGFYIGCGGVYNDWAGTMIANGGRVSDCSGDTSALCNDGTVRADAGAALTEFEGSVKNRNNIEDSAKCSVTFDLADGSGNVTTQRVLRGQTVSQPGDPARDGYEFLGWFINGAAYAFTKPVTETTLTLTAHWRASLTGSGTAEAPYQIGTADQLKAFRDMVNSGEYGLCAVLTADIDLENEAWTPIGNSTNEAVTDAYSGTFDGGGHTISGLNITGNFWHAGLFGITFNATIQNLSVSGSVSASAQKAGGIVGSAARGTTIKNCSNHCEVFNLTSTGTPFTGSIAGAVHGKFIPAPGEAPPPVNAGATVIDCYNTGSIYSEAEESNIGGIAGINQGTISNCYNVGSVSCNGERAYIGSIVGLMPGWSSIGTVENCYYLDGAGLNTVGRNDKEDNITKTEPKSAAEFADGTVLAQLIGDRAESEHPWAAECKYVTAAGTILPVFKGQGDAHEHSGAWTSNGNSTHSRTCACGVTETVNCSGGTATCKEKAVCDVCKAEYGATAPDNHGGKLTHVDAKAATTSEEGNIEYWHCEACGKYFSDNAATKEITQAETVIPKRNFSGSTSSYPITVPDKTENGSVSVNPKNASKGSTVTITVTPDSGYVLETISVIDKNGNDLKLTDKGNGKYTFTMPGSKVEVKVTFMEDNSVLNFFYDMPNDAYYYEAVKWAAENGITGGVGNSLFAPNQPCTRAQIVTFLWRVAGSPVVNYLMPFTDVDESAYYAEAVRWAASTGIVTGLTETTFGANGVCTRAQAAAMIYRHAQAQGKGFTGAWMFLLPFTDVPEWAYESVAWCYMNGVTTGVSETAFAPGNDCTRAQIVTFLWRAFSK